MCVTLNRPPSVVACYFHHRLLLNPEQAEMVTDETAAAAGRDNVTEQDTFFLPGEES